MTTPATTTTETPTEPKPTEPAPEPTETEETFPREYVEQLRQENAGYRTRAGQADALAQRLHLALVTATGRLADPTDLPYDAAHLEEDGALTTAVDELLQRKPHLADRRPHGDADQGARSTSSGDVDLAGMLRSRT